MKKKEVNLYTHTQERKKNIGEAWATLRTNVLVFTNDVLKIAEATWNKIKELAGVTGESTAAANGNNDNAGGIMEAGSNIPQRDSNPPVSEAIPSADAPLNDQKPPTRIDMGTLAMYQMTYPQNKSKTIDNPDGTQSTYDQSGMLTKITYTNPDALKGKKKLEVKTENGKVSYIEKKYDANGNVVEKVTYNSDGTVNNYVKFDVDEHGNSIKDVHYNSNGTINYYWKSEYNSSNKSIKDVRYNSDGSVNYYFVNEYDKEGNRTKEIYYKPDGTIEYYDVHEYDEEGNKTNSTRYNPDGTVCED